MSLPLDPKHLHHAYLIEGERGETLPALLSFLKKEKLGKEGEPDFHLAEFDGLGIDDALELRRMQTLTAAEGKKKLFVVAFNTATSEAQNALLKTLEDPTPDTHFFLLTRTRAMLLPTVLSRMQTVSLVEEKKVRPRGEEFLSMGVASRLVVVGKFAKAKADEKGDAKEEARGLLSDIETALASRIDKGSEYRSALEHVILAKRYLSDRGPSLKILLEQLAFVVPVEG